MPRVELGSEFSTLDAGTAASQLLESIRTRLRSKQSSEPDRAGGQKS